MIELVQGLEPALPPGLNLACQAIGDHTGSLHPAEHELVERAANLRKWEFSTGRLLAHRLLTALVPTHGPLLRGASREPLWPAGTVGSISHASGFCLVVVGSTDDFLGVGADLQADHPAAGTASLILSDAETRSQQSSRQLRLKFSAKEAVFKCLFSLVGAQIGFRDLTITLEPTRAEFAARSAASKPWADLLTTGKGKYVDDEAAAVCVFWLGAR